MDLQIKPLALAIAMASLSSFSIAETVVQSETAVNAEEAPSETLENATEVPVESSSDPLSVQFTEAQAASLDFSTFNAFKQSLSAVLAEVLPEETFVAVSDGIQLVTPEVDTTAAISSDVSLDINQLFDGFFEAQETEGFSALSYKKEMLLNLGTVYGFEVSFSVKATEVIADEKAIPEPENLGVGNAGIIAGIAGAAAALGGGSSSSSSSTYSSTIEGSYLAEYQANDALAFQNILSLNDYGYTGDGIKVGVVDSGIDASHQEFDGKTIYGVDFAGSPSSFDEDESGHGTHVASIIAGDRDQSGMRGMAYDATLYSYKVDNDGDSGLEGLSSDAAIAAIFTRHVTDDLDISNNSWGGSTAITATSEAAIRATYGSTITAMRSFQSNGGIIIFASGNDSRAQADSWGGSPYFISELANEWLVVTSVDSDGDEASYANRCGVASAFCVTAVGGATAGAGGVYGAATGTIDSTTNNYVRYQGTSMAAPHVTGLVAALMEKFPSLTAAQIVTRVKDGASYTGLTGRGGETSSNSTTAQLEAIFGHGLINATASSSAMGTLLYPTGSNLSDGSIALGANQLQLPAGLSPQTVKAILDLEYGVFDSFDGARFFIKGEDIFNAQSTNSMPRLGMTPIYSNAATVSLNYAENGNSSFYAFASGPADTVGLASSFWGSKAGLFNSFSGPEDVNVSQFEWKLDGGLGSVHPFVRTSEDGSVYSSGASLRVTPNDWIAGYFGSSIDRSVMDLGLTNSSATTTDTKTLEAGVEFNITEAVSVFGRVNRQRIDNIEASISSVGISSAESMGTTYGIHWSGVNTKLAFGVYQPATLSNGTLEFVNAKGRTQNDQIIWDTQSVALSEGGHDPLFFAFERQAGDDTVWSLSMKESEIYRGHVGGAEISFTYGF